MMKFADLPVLTSINMRQRVNEPCVVYRNGKRAHQKEGEIGWYIHAGVPVLTYGEPSLILDPSEYRDAKNRGKVFGPLVNGDVLYLPFEVDSEPNKRLFKYYRPPITPTKSSMSYPVIDQRQILWWIGETCYLYDGGDPKRRKSGLIGWTDPSDIPLLVSDKGGEDAIVRFRDDEVLGTEEDEQILCEIKDWDLLDINRRGELYLVLFERGDGWRESVENGRSRGQPPPWNW